MYNFRWIIYIVSGIWHKLFSILTSFSSFVVMVKSFRWWIWLTCVMCIKPTCQFMFEIKKPPICTLLRATLDKSIFLLSKLICSKYGCSTNWMRVREKEETNKFWGIVCDAETESYHIIYQIAYIQLYMREQNQVCQITISTNR